MDSDIKIIRSIYTSRTTIGNVYLGDEAEKFCFSLEDTVRGRGIKIMGETAIPEGKYKWHVTRSHRFKRDMISIYTEPNGYELIAYDIGFKGLRMHGGNTHVDTAGCPLVAFNKVNNSTIHKSAEKKLTEWAKSVGSNGIITFVNS